MLLQFPAWCKDGLETIFMHSVHAWMTAKNQAKFLVPSFKLRPARAFKPCGNYKLFFLINFGLHVPLACGYAGYS